MTFAERAARPDRPGGLLRCPDPDPDCACHDAQNEHAPQPAEVIRSGGHPLDPTVRSTMERTFGHDFSRVRVHADEPAAASARDLNALAYSVGPDLVFGPGRYSPSTPTGRQLIAHELAHVVQRDSSTRDAAGVPALEHDADRAATAVAAGRAPAIQHHAAGGTPLRAPAPAGPAPAETETQATQPAPPKLPDFEQASNIGRHGNLDAGYSRTMALLTVQLKVKFVQDEGLKRWPSKARFQRFVRQFVEKVTKRWSFKHFLVPDGDAPGEPQQVSVRVQVVPVESGQHVTANVRFADDHPQSSVSGDRTTATLDQFDTAQRGDIPQTPADHEFGHMLGLEHIHCDRNDDDCYGTNETELADVMGEGSFVSPRDYGVFAEILQTLTGKPWRVKPASVIPRGRAEAIGGAVGAVFGALALGAIGGAIGSMFGPLGIGLGAMVGGLVGMLGGFFAGRAIAKPRVPS